MTKETRMTLLRTHMLALYTAPIRLLYVLYDASSSSAVLPTDASAHTCPTTHVLVSCPFSVLQILYHTYTFLPSLPKCVLPCVPYMTACLTSSTCLLKYAFDVLCVSRLLVFRLRLYIFSPRRFHRLWHNEEQRRFHLVQGMSSRSLLANSRYPCAR